MGAYARRTSRSKRFPLKVTTCVKFSSSATSFSTSCSNQRRKPWSLSQVTATATPNARMFDQPPSTSCDSRSVSMSRYISRSNSPAVRFSPRRHTLFSRFYRLMFKLKRSVDARFALSAGVVDVDDFRVGVEIDCRVAHLARPHARFFRPAKRHMRFAADRGRIDVRHSSLNFVHKLENLVRVGR